MLNTHRFQSDEIPNRLKAGMLVDWCGQPCLVFGIDKGAPRPVSIQGKLASQLREQVGFEEINDILGWDNGVRGYLGYGMDALSQELSDIVKALKKIFEWE